MADYLLDANILIGVFRGDEKLRSFVEGLDATIDTTVYAELIQGAKDKRQVKEIEAAISQYRIEHFDLHISRRTIDLIRTYSKSHSLMFGDAIIAATCLEKGLELVTFNVRDFRFIEGLRLTVPKL